MFTRLATALALVVLAVPPEGFAWTWPVPGEVIRGFDYGGGAYTSSGHRGIDVAGPSGSEVRAPAAGRVTFAGSLPTNGRTVSIRTEDGWAVTLTHLGSVTVSVGDGVAEGETVGTIAAAEPSAVPYVQLGTRRADDPRGYVDPLTLLPPRQAAPSAAVVPAPSAPAPQPAPVTAEPAPAEALPENEVMRGTAPAGAAPADSVATEARESLDERSAEAPRDSIRALASSLPVDRGAARDAPHCTSAPPACGGGAPDRRALRGPSSGPRDRAFGRTHAAGSRFGRSAQAGDARACTGSGFPSAVASRRRGAARSGGPSHAPAKGQDNACRGSGSREARAYHGRP